MFIIHEIANVLTFKGFMFVNVSEAISVLQIKCQREPPFKKTIYEDIKRIKRPSVVIQMNKKIGKLNFTFEIVYIM